MRVAAAEIKAGIINSDRYPLLFLVDIVWDETLDMAVRGHAAAFRPSAGGLRWKYSSGGGVNSDSDAACLSPWPKSLEACHLRWDDIELNRVQAT